MDDIEQLIGADPVAGGWRGTLRATSFWTGAEMTARVTELAPTAELARAAALRWAGRKEDGRFHWAPRVDDPTRYGVLFEAGLSGLMGCPLSPSCSRMGPSLRARNDALVLD